MKNKMILLLIIIPIFCFGQWNLLGSTIDGTVDNEMLGSFRATAIDADGTTIAVGSYDNYAKVLDWNGTAWIQRGVTFGGGPGLEGIGSAVDLSADGNTVAISSPAALNSMGYNSGVVNIYDWNGTAWVLRGNTIEGEGTPPPLIAGDNFGAALALSSDGNYLAVGAPYNTQAINVLEYQGHVRVYNWNGQNWTQVGQDLDGVSSFEYFGTVLDISDDGLNLSVGISTGGTVGTYEIGIVRNYTWNGTQWIARGAQMVGVNDNDHFGASVSLNGDGNTLAIGSENASGASSTHIFEWANNQWTPKGNNILAVNNVSRGPYNDISDDGNMIVISEAYIHSPNGTAKVYEWNGTQWVQLNNTMFSSNGNNYFGSSVRLSANKSSVIIGAPAQNINALFAAGSVYVFQNPTVLTVNHLSKESNLTVYPNPTSNQIHIEAPVDIQELKLYSALGQEIWTKTGNGKQVDLSLSNQVSGIYWLILQTATGTESVQITKQ